MSCFSKSVFDIYFTGSSSGKGSSAELAGGGTRLHILLKRSQESHDKSLSTNDVHPDR